MYGTGISCKSASTSTIPVNHLIKINKKIFFIHAGYEMFSDTGSRTPIDGSKSTGAGTHRQWTAMALSRRSLERGREMRLSWLACWNVDISRA
jgi:hypothetical protein